MEEELKTLTDLVDLLESKSTTEDFVAAIGKVVDFVEQIKVENDTERAALKVRTTELVTTALESAKKNLKVYSETEWEKIQKRINAIKDGRDGKDGKDGRDGVGIDGKDGREGPKGDRGESGKDGVDGRDGKDGAPDTPDQVVEKVNKSKLLISKDRVEGLVDVMRNIAANAVASVGVTTSFFNGLRAKNLNIIGGTATQVGDTVNVTVGSTGSSNSIQELTADPALPDPEEVWVLRQTTGSGGGGGKLNGFFGLGFPLLSVGSGAIYSYQFSFRTLEGTTKRVLLT